MVYKLQKASKFLLFKISVLLIILVIIIASIGILLANFVLAFDHESFNPAIINESTYNGNSSNLLCSRYFTTDCHWLFLQDINNPNFPPQQKVVLIDSANQLMTNLSDQHFYVVNDTSTGIISLGSLVVTASSSNVSNLHVLCGDFSGQSNSGCGLTLTPVHVYAFNNNTLFKAGQALFLANNNVVVCSDYLSSTCGYTQYDQNLTSFRSKTPVSIINGKTTSICNGTIILDNSSGDPYCYITGYTALITAQAYLKPTITTSDIFCRFDTNTCQNLGININDQSYANIFVMSTTNKSLIITQLYLRHALAKDNTWPTPQNPLPPFDQQQIYCAFSYSSYSTTYSNTTFSNKQCISNQIKYNLIYGVTDKNSQTFPATLYPKLFIQTTPQTTSNGIIIRYAFGIEDFQIPPNLLNVLGHSVASILNQNILNVTFLIYLLIIPNIIVALVIMWLKLWTKLSRILCPRLTLALNGRLGFLLELTQFFDFRGDWYLENTLIYEYNLHNTSSIFKTLIIDRWHDVLFFPTVLSSALALLLVVLTNKPDYFLSVFIIAPFTPLLLTFWTPNLWTVEDAGLKAMMYQKTGEISNINKISAIIREGFNKLVGIGAIIGIGTTGATAIRSSLTGTSFTSSASSLSSSLEDLLSFNLNFLASALLWMLTVSILVIALSLLGNILVSIHYLNGEHIENIKHFREALQKKQIYLGSIQQSMNPRETDSALYYDSSKKS